MSARNTDRAARSRNTDMNYLEAKEYAPKPGIYHLARDVINPNPDRRMRHDWRRLEIWPRRLRLIVHAHWELGLSIEGTRYSHESITPRQSQQWVALVPNLEPEEPTVENVILHHRRVEDGYADAEDVIAQLVLDGDITLDQLRETLQIANERIKKEPT